MGTPPLGKQEGWGDLLFLLEMLPLPLPQGMTFSGTPTLENMNTQLCKKTRLLACSLAQATDVSGAPSPII